MRLRLSFVAFVGICAMPTAVLAQDSEQDYEVEEVEEVTDAEGRDFSYAMPPQPSQPDQRRLQWEADRTAWLTECRTRMNTANVEVLDEREDGKSRKRSSGIVGGAVGGVAGGLLGRTIAGGNDRTLGTVVGAVAGTAAGAVIERSVSSSGKERTDSQQRVASRGYAGDYCEQYFNYYTQQHSAVPTAQCR